jgi:hypothetical protein
VPLPNETTSVEFVLKAIAAGTVATELPFRCIETPSTVD